MNILTICQYYYPEPFRITDICEEFVKRGHSVTVVTGIPNYPMGEIYDGYKHGEKRDEVINGVNVHRCFTIGRKKGVLRRFLNYFSYAISSSKYVSKLKDDFDVVFVNQLSPVLMANAGIKYKQKYDKMLILYCLDLWPESIVAGGIKRGSLIYKLFHRISKSLYQHADKILVTSKSFSTYFKKEFQIENTEYLPQYAESFFSPELCRKEPDEYIDLMFCGNIGSAQSVSMIIEAANLAKEIKNLRWHIVGDGSELENVRSLSYEYGLTSVFFYERQPVEKMPKYYAMADVMLVTMKKDPVISWTLPGKVQTYMAAGKPIIGAIDGETQKVITESQCGFCSESDDAKKLVESVKRFCKMTLAERSSMGQNAYTYYVKHFHKDTFFTRLITSYLELNKTRSKNEKIS